MDKTHDQRVRVVTWRKAFGTSHPSDPPYGGIKKIDRTLVEYLMRRIRNGQEPELLVSAWVDPRFRHVSIGLAIVDELEVETNNLEKFLI
jgi:hypothetical protein